MPRIALAFLLLVLASIPASAGNWREYPPHLHPQQRPDLDAILLERMHQAALEYAALGDESGTPGSGKPLYARLGGHDAIAAVVDSFVDRLVADPVQTANPAIKEAFGKTDVPQLKDHLTAFVCNATGGPETYPGRPNKEVHADMQIGEKEWSAAVADLVATLDKFKVPKSEQDELIGIVATTKADVVTRP